MYIEIFICILQLILIGSGRLHVNSSVSSTSYLTALVVSFVPRGGVIRYFIMVILYLVLVVAVDFSLYSLVWLRLLVLKGF